MEGKNREKSGARRLPNTCQRGPEFGFQVPMKSWVDMVAHVCDPELDVVRGKRIRGTGQGLKA